MTDAEKNTAWDDEDLSSDDLDMDNVTDFSDALRSLGEQLQEHQDDPQDDDLMIDLEADQAVSQADASAQEDYSFEDETVIMNHDSYTPAAEADGAEELVAPVEPVFEEAHVEEEVFQDYPTYEEESATDTFETESVETELTPEPTYATEATEMVEEPVAAPSYEAVADPSSKPAAEGMEHFNLTTLTQLIQDIRAEGERVAHMKDSVAKALGLIQEMSESLKS